MTAVSYNVNEPEAARLLCNEFNEDLPVAGQPLTAGVSVEGSGRAAYLNISFSSGASALLSLTRTVGAVTVTEALKAGANVAADTLHQETVLVVPGEIINLIYGSAGDTYSCRVAAVVQNG